MRIDRTVYEYDFGLREIEFHDERIGIGYPEGAFIRPQRAS